jgi:hypothetical protein
VQALSDEIVLEVVDTYRNWVACERRQLPCAGGLEDQTLILDGLLVLDREWRLIEALNHAPDAAAQTSA